MKNKIIALLLVVILIFSFGFTTYAETQQSFNEVTLSMYCNVSEKRRITGVYSKNNFYVKADDLCDVANGEITEQTEESIVVSCNYGIRNIKIYHTTQNMTEDPQEERLITMPVIEYENTRYYSLLHFLRYLGINVSIEEKAETQLKIFVRYNIFDAIGEYIEKNKGNFFWWDEVECTENENLEDKLVNAGVVALINRDSNIFRMMFDAEGIEREALEDALVSILTNEGESYFNEKNSGLDSLNLANDALGFTADVAGFIVDAYKSDATENLGKFINGFSTASTISANSAVNFVNAFTTMKQFDAITETQRTLLENTILKYPKDSALLCGEWARLQEAAKNVNIRVKDAFANGFEAANEAVTGIAYDLLQGSVSNGNPVAFAWSGAIFINKLIPYTSNMIDKKTQLYNAYISSIIQMVANELLSDAVSDLNDADFMQFNSTSQYEHLFESKNSLALQLKSTLTTREYLIKSEFLEKSYAEEMKGMNKQTAELLNKIENCKIVLVGMEPSISEDLTWMENYVSSDKLSYEMREEYFESKTSTGILFLTNKISYPYFLGSSEVEKKINARYEEIINNYRESSSEDIESWYETVLEYDELYKLPFYNNMEITVSYNGNGYVSLLEWVHDWPGGMHPYHYENGITYDIETAQEVDYSRFFIGNDEEIKNLLNKKASDLGYSNYYQDKWYENSQFVLTTDGICFYFWVGDAVARQEIIVPYSEGEEPFVYINPQQNKVPATKDGALSKEEIKELFIKANNLYDGWLCHGWAPELDKNNIITINGNQYAYITSSDFNSVSSLKNELKKYFSEEIYRDYIGHYYIMKDGKMYGRVELGQGGDMHPNKLSLTINSMSEKECSFTVTSYYNQGDSYSNDYKIKLINGNWIFVENFVENLGLYFNNDMQWLS